MIAGAKAIVDVCPIIDSKSLTLTCHLLHRLYLPDQSAQYHASSTSVSLFVLRYIVHAYLFWIYFFLFFPPNTLACSGLLQIAPSFYHVCNPCANYLLYESENPRGGFHILLWIRRSTNFKGRLSNLFHSSSLRTCAFTSRGGLGGTQTSFQCAHL